MLRAEVAQFRKTSSATLRIFCWRLVRLRTSHYSPPKAKNLRNCGIVSRVLQSGLFWMVKNRGKSGKKSSRARPRLNRRQRKPAVAIVGAGRLGTALGQALNNTGYRVEIVVAKRRTS